MFTRIHHTIRTKNLHTPSRNSPLTFWEALTCVPFVTNLQPQCLMNRFRSDCFRYPSGLVCKSRGYQIQFPPHRNLRTPCTAPRDHAASLWFARAEGPALFQPSCTRIPVATHRQSQPPPGSCTVRNRGNSQRVLDGQGIGRVI
jgi:hypothetical protein